MHENDIGDGYARADNSRLATSDAVTGFNVVRHASLMLLQNRTGKASRRYSSSGDEERRALCVLAHLPVKMCQGHQGEIHRQEKAGKQQRKDQSLEARERILSLCRNIYQEPARVEKKVPAVPAQKPAQINTEAAQAENYENEQPAGLHSASLAHYLLHQQERDQTQKKPGPGKGHKEQKIEPQRHGIVWAQVNDVGYQIGRVGKESQPENRTYADEQPVDPRTPAMEVMGGEGPERREPRQKKIPH